MRAHLSEQPVIYEPQFTVEPAPREGAWAFEFELVSSSRRAGPCGSDWALYQRR